MDYHLSSFLSLTSLYIKDEMLYSFFIHNNTSLDSYYLIRIRKRGQQSLSLLRGKTIKINKRISAKVTQKIISCYFYSSSSPHLLLFFIV